MTTETMERQLARHEQWLAGDWDSRSARGIAARDRHAAERDRLRAAILAEQDRHTCHCGMPRHCEIRSAK